LADNGTSVIAISSDVDEIAELCDRVIVMNEGHLVGELKGDEIRPENIIALSFHRKDQK
jgi:ABC-type sugar transport system ATPase subunit